MDEAASVWNDETGLVVEDGAEPRSAAIPVRRSSPGLVIRNRAYAFLLDPHGRPVEVGSGRSAKVYLGEERWLQSKTDFRREVVIKVLQKGVSDADALRFQLEKELLERVQGHPNIVELFASGEAEDAEFIPAAVRHKLEGEFLVLERLDGSLEERLKGSRDRREREDLLAYEPRERLLRALEIVLPVASAIEFAHIERNVCHRDIKPANVLVRHRDPALRGSRQEVRLADFNVGKVHEPRVDFALTRAAPTGPQGTLFFQSPEQETNVLELLVNVEHGSNEVHLFEDLYVPISRNDTFSLWSGEEAYHVMCADRPGRRLLLGCTYRGPTETRVRGRVRKSVGRPADIYALGALLYYLVSGASANPKSLYNDFLKFIEYDASDASNTIEAYLAHQYGRIAALDVPRKRGAPVTPGDPFFTYKHYLDGNGRLIELPVMRVIAKCMIRNKPDSYCDVEDLETRGIRTLVGELIELHPLYGAKAARLA